MSKEDQIKPWVRQVVAMAIPFDEENKFWIESKYDGLICLTKERWEHVLTTHPEINLEMNWDKISDTLINPDYVAPENNTRVYYKKFEMEVSFDNKDTLIPEDRKFFTVVIQVKDKYILTIFEQKGIKDRHKPKDQSK